MFHALDRRWDGCDGPSAPRIYMTDAAVAEVGIGFR